MSGPKRVVFFPLGSKKYEKNNRCHSHEHTTNLFFLFDNTTAVKTECVLAEKQVDSSVSTFPLLLTCKLSTFQFKKAEDYFQCRLKLVRIWFALRNNPSVSGLAGGFPVCTPCCWRGYEWEVTVAFHLIMSRLLRSLPCNPLHGSVILFVCLCSFLLCFNTQIRRVLFFLL